MVLHHTAFSLKEIEKVNNNAYGKSQICIENVKIKKPRKSHQGKLIFSRCDFLGEDQAEETRVILQKWSCTFVSWFYDWDFFSKSMSQIEWGFIFVSIGWTFVSWLYNCLSGYLQERVFSKSISQIKWGFLLVSIGCTFVSWLYNYLPGYLHEEVLSPRAKKYVAFYLSPLVVYLSCGYTIISLVIFKREFFLSPRAK